MAVRRSALLSDLRAELELDMSKIVAGPPPGRFAQLVPAGMTGRIRPAPGRHTAMRSISLLLAAACATSGSPTGGTIAIKSFGYPSARPVSYSVGKGVISGSNLDARLDQGCIRGTMRGTPILLCSDPANPNHWSGTTGDFTAVLNPNGRSVNVEGFLLLDPTRQVMLNQVIPLGDGPAWDELRRNPALLVIASTAADLQAAHIRT